MPVDTGIVLPFPPAISPDEPRAHAHSIAWMRERGLLPAEAVPYFASMRLAEFAARWWPRATGEDLDRLADCVCWIGYYDDQVDSTEGARAEQVRQDCVDLIAVVDGVALAHEPSAMTAAFMSLWGWLNAGDMSAAFRARNARYWRGYFVSKLDELDRQRVPADLDAYIAHRYQAGAGQICLAAAERVYGLEVDDRVIESPLVQQLWHEAVFLMHVINDVVGVERERARGEVQNAVMILERVHRCSFEEAVALTIREVDRHTERFVALERAFAAWAAENLSGREREAAESWVYTMRSIVRGTLDGAHSGRYTPQGGELALRSGYEDQKGAARESV